MKFIILGSGGCVSIPRPLCKCKVCNEARQKGVPYSRFGCSLYLDDINMLVDTPEDVCYALNYFNIERIDSVLYSHMDPDHTLGMRVFEQLKLNWLTYSLGEKCENPINVYALPQVIDDLNKISSKYGNFFDYYENVINTIRRKPVEKLLLQDINITFVKANNATVFVFEQNNKKLIYAPCDVKPFPDSELFNNADVMIIGNTVIGKVLKDGFVLDDDNLLKKELFSMDEIVGLKDKYKIKNVIMTHIEEDWGKSYDDYIELQKQYKGIRFGYDGMKIIL